MIRQLFDAIAARPMVATLAVVLGVEFGRAFVTERARLLRVMRETVTDLDRRSAEIELRMRRAYGEESNAETTLTDAELTARIMP